MSVQVLLISFNHEEAEYSENSRSDDCHHGGDDDVVVILFSYRDGQEVCFKELETSEVAPTNVLQSHASHRACGMPKTSFHH